ncbi:MAG: hypothetical protein IIV54_03055 [Bacteroidaceae bacterium]|nr:hypothetical protein [Bacteroidaceae bacterium]
MKYLHTLLALCAVVLFSACNDLVDFDKNMDHNYGAELEKGLYSSQYNVNSKYEYNLVVTENAKGEPTVYSYRVGKPGTSDSAVVRTTFVSEEVAYDAKTGVLSAKASTSYYEVESDLYLCKLQNGNLIYELNYDVKKDKATMAKSSATPTVEGKWQAANADSSVVYNFFLSAANAEGAGAAIVSKNGGADEVGTYTTAHGTTTVTVGAATYTLAFNGKFQLVATTDAETLVLDRVVSDPEPEQFLPIFGGVYTCNMFGMQFEAVLYQSDKYPENFIISPYMYSQKPMYFTMNADGSLVVEKQETGLYYDAKEGKVYGQEVPGGYQIYVSDGVTYSGTASPLSVYDQSKGVFNFALIWHIDQGYFNEAPEVDTFQLTEELSNKKEPSFMKVQKLDKPFSFDKKLPLFKK